MGINSAPGGNMASGNMGKKPILEKGAIEIAPEGWVTTGALEKRFNTDSRTIKKEVEKYRLEHPGWIKIFKDSMGKPVEHYSPEVQTIIEQRFNQEPSAPEGWLTKKEICGITNRTEQKIEKVIELLKPEHPEWFGNFQHRNHRIFEYYSPEFFKKIKEILEQEEIAPEGWKNIFQISSELNRTYGIVQVTADRFRPEHPEWFKRFKSKQGPIRDFLSPELVEQIKTLIGRTENTENPPKGWVVSRILARSLGRSTKVVRGVANTYKKEHPEWFGMYKTSDGDIGECFSPELADEIIERFTPVENGWVGLKELAKRFGVSEEVIKKAIAELDPNFPDQKRIVISKTSGRAIIYCSPNLIEGVRKKIFEKGFPPERWLTKTQIVNQTGSNYGRISIIITTNIKEHPEWLQEFVSKRGRVQQYYSPELLTIIEKELFSVEKAPIDWMPITRVVNLLQRSSELISKIAGKYRESKPEWFKTYLSNESGQTLEHYAPELIKILKKEFEQYKEAPEGWMTNGAIAKKFDRAFTQVKISADRFRPEHPEWFKRFNTPSGFYEHYSPELINIITELVAETPPEGWLIAFSLEKELGRSGNKIQKIAAEYREEHPEWFKKYRSKRGSEEEHFSPELVNIIRKRLLEHALPPEGWLQQIDLVRATGRGYQKIQISIEKIKEEHPEWFGKFRGYHNMIQEFCSPEVLTLLRVEFAGQDKPPSGWITVNTLSKDFGHSSEYLRKLLGPLRILYPQEFGMFLGSKGLLEHYSPRILELLRENILKPAPIGWLLNHELAEKTGRAEATVKSAVKRFRPEHPEWFKVYLSKRGTSEFYSPELVEIIEKELSKNLETSGKTEGSEKLKQNLVSFIEDVSKSEKIEASQFKNLVGLFGSSRAIDVLYKFHPEFKGLPVQYVKSVIAEYIGDFLVLRHGFRGETVANAVEYLNDPSLREGLLEVLKESCLEYFHVQKKADPSKDNWNIVQDYIKTVREETGNLNNKDLNLVINELEEYYRRLLAIGKPERLVDEVKEGREFPDLNQRINIQEIAEKKKILIADEMGLGKSASVILAKESLKVKQALVVAPSNVIDTWKNYLKNYFKPGQEPKVLIVDSLESLRQDLSSYEYILVSQERLNDEYTKELLKINPGMLVVDEVHKLKNLKEGVRAQNLVALAEQIQGDDKYMAILSGTPVPNKIADVAMILKLLYPDKFQNVDSREMVVNIIHGDLIDLRSLLLPRMQMKSLKESIEMPQYVENPPTLIELTETERDIYGALLEEDELTATQKIQLLRQFILNPEIIDATPGIPNSKFIEFEKNLKQDFQKVDKIVVFVNNYVEGVIRGDKSLVPKLDLPPDVEVRIIEGEVSKEEREQIQKELNTSNKKILLMVSGQTADVGVDFSGGEMVYFFNEPWTKADQAQQLARVYRPGLAHDLESKTFITSATIEEGIHRFIALKQRSVEKLLKGIPLTELDREILEKTEQQDENREVNPELATYYFNSWDRLMRIFGEVREIGEKEFMSYLDKYGKEMTHGEEYAKAYFDLGNRSYQSNANRVAATLIHDFMVKANQKPEDVRILDLASGPEMLKRHIADELTERIVSIDINPAHFSRSKGDKRVVGQLTTLPFAEKSFDYLNLTFALHYSRLVPTRNQLERLQIFKEMNHVLREGGRVVIDLVHSIDMKDFDSFRENIKLFGFRIVEDYTGEIKEGDRYKSKIITLEKTKDVERDFSIEELVKRMDKKQLNGFKFQDVEDKLKDQRQIITRFKIGDKEFAIQFNDSDQKIYEEEQAILQKGEELKSTYRAIENIPKEEIVSNSFIRYRPKNSYRLFRRLRVSEGGVVIK